MQLLQQLIVFLIHTLLIHTLKDTIKKEKEHSHSQVAKANRAEWLNNHQCCVGTLE